MSLNVALRLRVGATALAAAAALASTVRAAPAEVPDSMAQRVKACTLCHGREGRAAPDGYYPRIAGKPAGYLYEQLLNFRDGRRRYAPMAALLQPLSDDYLQRIAQHFATLELPYPPPAPGLAEAGLLARGQALVLQGDRAQRLPACAACHGRALTGRQTAVPGLLGLSRDYLVAQLGAWQTGQRRARAPDCMAEIARRLAPSDAAAVAAWLSAQPLPADARAPEAARDADSLPLECGSVEAAR